MFRNELIKFSTEDLIDFISLKKIEKETFEENIKNSSLNLYQKSYFSQKINVAYQRIIEPLELSLRIFYLFVPFGIVNSFLDTHEQELERFKKFRFIKKINQYYLFSFLGVTIYIFVGIALSVFF